MSLELVSNNVEETILLFIAADFAYEKNGVDRYTGNDESEEDDTEDQRDDSAPIEDD
jgi:hypothetical protein